MTTPVNVLQFQLRRCPVEVHSNEEFVSWEGSYRFQKHDSLEKDTSHDTKLFFDES